MPRRDQPRLPHSASTLAWTFPSRRLPLCFNPLVHQAEQEDVAAIAGRIKGTGQPKKRKVSAPVDESEFVDSAVAKKRKAPHALSCPSS